MLEQYVTHAEKFGAECVYETAQETGLEQLDSLAAHLTRIDKNWRLTKPQSDELIDTLLDRGFTAQRVSELTPVSLRTVKNRMVERKKSAKTKGSGHRPGGGDFCTFEANGGRA